MLNRLSALGRFVKRPSVFIGGPLLVLVLFGAWAGWRVYQVYGDLKAAETAARAALSAAQSQDRTGLDAAVVELQARAASAEQRTGGLTWGLLGKFPVVGDDARGVRAMSQALDLIGSEAAQPLVQSFDTIRTLNHNGRIDLDAVRSLRDPASLSQDALAQAVDLLAAENPEGFVAALGVPYRDFAEVVQGLDEGLVAAKDLSEVLPTALGGEGQRTYLVVFLNNAEIRSSGGLPGAFAEVVAKNGKLSMGKQGGPTQMGAEPERPVLPLSKEELSFFGPQLGTYFQDANFIQDMPRTAELMAARYQQWSGTQVDGVLTLDTVGMSYLLDGAGTVTTPDGVRLTSANAVSELLNRTYFSIPDPAVQDVRFASVAQSTFTAVTSGVSDQLALVKGLGRAAGEGRLLVHLFRPEEQQVLVGTRVAGELTSAPSDSPEVDLGFDDATASKMSYYLRYEPEVKATSCQRGVQQLLGQVRLTSEISSKLAASLPISISGGGEYGTEPGNQMPMLRIYGPVAGSISAVQVDGKPVDVDRVNLNGRPAVSLPLLLEPSQSATVTWQMTSGPGQSGAIDLGVTPSIEPGDFNATLPSACG